MCSRDLRGPGFPQSPHSSLRLWAWPSPAWLWSMTSQSVLFGTTASVHKEANYCTRLAENLGVELYTNFGVESQGHSLIIFKLVWHSFPSISALSSCSDLLLYLSSLSPEVHRPVSLHSLAAWEVQLILLMAQDHLQTQIKLFFYF